MQDHEYSFEREIKPEALSRLMEQTGWGRGRTLEGLDVGDVRWLFDASVSNSGRLKVLLEERAGEQGWPWEVHLLRRVDQHLADSNHIVVTSDSWILDRAGAWYPVIDAVVAATGSGGRVLDLSRD